MQYKQFKHMKALTNEKQILFKRKIFHGYGDESKVEKELEEKTVVATKFTKKKQKMQLQRYNLQ